MFYVEHFMIGGAMEQYQGHRDQRWGHISYAQHGDDFFLLNLFDLLKIKTPTYMDIGCHHPTTISNTKLLYDLGSKGLNVDANPYVMEAFKRERPRDVNLNVGVGPLAGLMQFYMHHRQGGRNTFDIKERDQWIAEGHPVVEVMPVKVVTINELVRYYFGGIWPDLLTMDIEGLDYQVLASAEYTHIYNRPKVVCVEVRRHDSKKMIELMGSKYFFCLCRITENLIFVDKALKDFVF